MTKLDHVVAALAARNRKVTPPDLTPIMDEIVSGVLTRQTDQAERERRLQASVKALEKNVGAMINAIPTTDLSSVIQAIRDTAAAVKAIKFPEVKFPPATDLGPVLQQAVGLQGAIAELSAKFDSFHVDMPEITVNTPEQKAVVVAEPEPRKWHFKIIRNSSGGIKEVEATAE